MLVKTVRLHFLVVSDKALTRVRRVRRVVVWGAGVGAKAACFDMGMRMPRECDGSANCFTARKKVFNKQCCRCRKVIDPKDGRLDVLAYPGPKAAGKVGARVHIVWSRGVTPTPG